ncbi:MAG: hypothetical protein ACYCSQ_00755 [bacterium]
MSDLKQTQEKKTVKNIFAKKKPIAVYVLAFLSFLVLTIFVNSVYINYSGGSSKIYALNLKKLTELKREEIHKEILRHPNRTTPNVIKAQITSFVKDMNADSKKYDSGVIIVKQAIIGGNGYVDITGKIETTLKKQGVL